MAQWSANDEANGAPIWVTAQVRKTVNTANRNALFGNTTADAFTTGLTEGVFAVDANEAASAAGKIAHAGWVLRTVGSGGRTGRIMNEVLVAGGISTDSEDTVFSDTVITISIQPASKSVNTDMSTTFSVGAVSVPVVSLSYIWEANTGSGFANLTNAGVYSNTTTSTLAISNTSGLTGVQYRVTVSATGANSVTSSAATLTVV